MDEFVFIKFFVPPATPLPPPALEMDTQDAGVTLIRSVAKPKLLRFDARSLDIFFFYFPIKVAGGHSLSSRGKSPAPGS